jgi:ribonuclease-3
MSDLDRLAEPRAKLRAHVDAVVGSGPIPRFEEALTHSSYGNETGTADNQRLEFLGDAVLGLCVSEMLGAAHTDADEGLLTRMRSALVNAEALASWARRVDLGATLAFGRGASLGAEREQTNVLADAAEALVAAVYDARGLDGARALVRDIVSERFDKIDVLGVLDPKSDLQERVQARGMPAPTYRVVSVTGAAHDQVFRVEVVLDESAVGHGEGRSKRQAEHAAARAAIEQLEKDGSLP